jgi:hypothetical protein
MKFPVEGSIGGLIWGHCPKSESAAFEARKPSSCPESDGQTKTAKEVFQAVNPAPLSGPPSSLGTRKLMALKRGD